MSDSDDAYGPALPPAVGTKDAHTASEQQHIIGPVVPSQLKSRQHHTSDSDASSSESDSTYIDNKRRKKIKRRSYSSDSSSDSDKKKKKHKKKYSSSESETSSSSSDSSHRKKKQTSKHKTKSYQSHEISEGRPSIGPVMPDGLKSAIKDKNHERHIGPAWPQGLRTSQATEDSDSDGDIGPSIGLQAQEGDLSAVREFEARANRMQDKFDGDGKAQDVPTQRESWMTELPEGLGARFGLGARQFRKEEAAEVDSSWTDKPGESKKKDSKKRSDDFTNEADMKAAKEMEKYNKKHRAESLLDMHKKELKKKKKKEKKKNKGKEKEKERQSFDRERDLKVNRLDEAQRKAIIKRSQELGSRFKSGGTGTSFL